MKLAIIVDRELPPGLAANAAAILGMSIGRSAPESLGHDVSDAGGSLHPGITRLPVPVLEADAETLRRIRASASANPALRFADFTDAAQRTRTYEEYAERLAAAAPDDLRYLGLCLFGDDVEVRRATGALPLLGRGGA